MLHSEKFKYKLMDLPSLYRALDRLTRIRNTEEKFNKVYNNVITNFLIEPKYSAEQLEKMEFELKQQIVSMIWSSSVYNLCKSNNIERKCTTFIEELLEQEEKSIFFANEDITYFNKWLDIENLLQFDCPLQPVPLNIQRLFKIDKTSDIITLRKTEGLKFPIEKIVVAEGITEEILLPVFADICGYNFDKNGIHLVAAGGKNQVAKWYVKNRKDIKIPVFILLDNDALTIKNVLSDILLPKDIIYLISEGEFEDILPKKLIKKTINYIFKNEFDIKTDELKTDVSACKSLKLLYHNHKVGDFKKADFAKNVAKILKDYPCMSDAICNIIENIKEIS